MSVTVTRVTVESYMRVMRVIDEIARELQELLTKMYNIKRVVRRN